MPARLDPYRKLMSKVQLDTGTGCWLWTGAVNPYGRVSWGSPRRTEYAHRASYELFIGPIPAEMVLDHLCCNRICINPCHLEPVTNYTNLRRGGKSGTPFCARYGPSVKNCGPRCQHRDSSTHSPEVDGESEVSEEGDRELLARERATNAR